MQKKNVGLIMGILSLIVMTLGATFAFFNASIIGNKDISVNAYNFSLNLKVSGEYTGRVLIPMYDEDVMKGYNKECYDNLGNGVCLSYIIELENIGDVVNVIGSINFEKVDVVNLSYMLIEENNNIWQPTVLTTLNNDLPLGNNIILDTGNIKRFKLIIWLSDTGLPQEDVDAGGSFNASVRYVSVSGGELKASISNN